jgi:hypothetical protein
MGLKVASPDGLSRLTIKPITSPIFSRHEEEKKNCNIVFLVIMLCDLCKCFQMGWSSLQA